VLVEESLSTMTVAQFLAVRWSARYEQIASGPVTIVLQWSQNVGEAMFVYRGVLYDVLGPMVTPSIALDIAKVLSQEV
jgi:hypothetical protein